jgi:hypothetical protein
MNVEYDGWNPSSVGLWWANVSASIRIIRSTVSDLFYLLWDMIVEVSLQADTTSGW